MVLVDGKGPPRRILPVLGTVGDRNDAFIEAFFTSSVGDYAEVRAAYRGIELRRRVFFADHSYFLVADEIDDPGRRHAYEWRLHGNGRRHQRGRVCPRGELGALDAGKGRAAGVFARPGRPSCARERGGSLL